MRRYPGRVNKGYPLWLPYTIAAFDLALGVDWLATNYGGLRLLGLAWLAVAGSFAWTGEAVRRDRARQRHGARQIPRP